MLKDFNILIFGYMEMISAYKCTHVLSFIENDKAGRMNKSKTYAIKKDKNISKTIISSAKKKNPIISSVTTGKRWHRCIENNKRKLSTEYNILDAASYQTIRTTLCF